MPTSEVVRGGDACGWQLSSTGPESKAGTCDLETGEVLLAQREDSWHIALVANGIMNVLFKKSIQVLEDWLEQNQPLHEQHFAASRECTIKSTNQ